MAQAYQTNNQPQAALESYNKALEKNPSSIGILVLKAGFLEAQSQYPAAAETYEKVLGIREGNKVAANNLAILLVDRLKSEKSVKRAVELASLLADSEVPNFLDTRGWVSYHAGDFSEAVALLEKAVALDDTQDIYKYHLGMAYHKLGESKSAESALRKALASGNPFAGKTDAIKVLQTL